MYVIGTAGHVDHGKSALVKALTGIDPDRLREEKERGMTIDLGFAWLRLPSGQEVGIVDVPGHERFIKNMLAGVGSVDLALLVVAADEGVMPQTREHLAILDFLDVRHGVVALSKRDLVDEEWLALVEVEVQEVLEGTTLAGSPIVACSAATGQGLPELVAALEEALAGTPPKRDVGRPRLAIDRVFTVAGFGTVVTGTLIDGSLAVGQEVEVLPRGLRARIRGLQSHQRKVEASRPGNRTAVNLIGPEKEELGRGMVLTTPGWLQPTSVVDVRLRAARDMLRPVRHNVEVTFHTGASEVTGRLLLLDREEIPPGETAWAQIRLEEPAAVARGDFFVVRSPNDTIGGGRIVEAHPRRHRRFHTPTLEVLTTLERGAPQELLVMTLAQREPCELAALGRSAELLVEEAREAVAALIGAGRIVAPGAGEPAARSQAEGLRPNTLLFTASGLSSLARRAAEALIAYHRQHPLRGGMAREELRSRLGIDPRPFNEVVALWLRQGELAEAGADRSADSRPSALRLPQHRPQLTPKQQAAADALLQAIGANPYSPPTDHLPEAEALAYLEEAGQVVRAGEVVFAAAAYQEMVQRVVAHLRQQGKVSLAQVRDMFGTSRKYALALLEHLDQQRLTRRVGDERVLR